MDFCGGLRIPDARASNCGWCTGPRLRQGLPPHRCLLWLYPPTSCCIAGLEWLASLDINDLHGIVADEWAWARPLVHQWPSSYRRSQVASIYPWCMLHVHAVKTGMRLFDCSGSASGQPGTLPVAGSPAWNRLSWPPQFVIWSVNRLSVCGNQVHVFLSRLTDSCTGWKSKKEQEQANFSMQVLC